MNHIIWNPRIPSMHVLAPTEIPHELPKDAENRFPVNPDSNSNATYINLPKRKRLYVNLVGVNIIYKRTHLSIHLPLGCIVNTE